MNENTERQRLNRRRFLRLGAQGAGILAAGALVPTVAMEAISRLGAGSAARAARQPLGGAQQAAAGMPSSATLQLRLAATDGFASIPGRDPLYVFGFIEVPWAAAVTELDPYKGHVRVPAPIIYMDEDDDAYVKLTNLGFQGRPDLDDSHTIHWHGFRNQIAIFDGVPEASIAVPVARDFNYFFRPHEEGTYMYHCHFEDTEHVQMGMDGVVFVRPAQDLGAGAIPPGKYAYNDGVMPADPRSTAFDREFALLMQDIDPHPHDGLIAVQEFIWSDYKPNYWIINGRCYPDTVKPNAGEPGADPALASQPVSSLIQVNAGERALLRLVNLGYEQHAMQLAGIPMRVVGEDATLLRGPGGASLQYNTGTVYIGPGESRDVIFEAPPHSGGGGPDVYLFKNRNLNKLTNSGVAGLGGMATEVRVYPGVSLADTVPPQTAPNQTFLV